MPDEGDDIIIVGSWMCSGWRFVLPQQSTALHMLVATATDRDLDGSLDALVAELGDGWFDHFTGGLDCPVRWGYPEVAIRAGLEVLTRGDVAILQLANGDVADPERIPRWAAFLAKLRFDTSVPGGLRR